MAAYEVLLLNTAVPQIQAAQAGDTYVVPRDIAFSAALTLSAGTANGIPYLNGSKVLTTGSALTFDGTNLSGPRLVASSTDATGSVIQVDTTATVYGQIGGSTSMGWKAGSQHIWNITAGEQMRLTSTGLGIGTSSPAAKLHVAGTGTQQALVQSTNGGTTSLQLLNSGVSSRVIKNVIGALVFEKDAVDQATLDSSGNLGLGVTPSAWGGAFRALQFEGGSGVHANTVAQDFNVINQAYNNGSGYVYQNSSQPVARYQQYQGTHKWFTAPSGTAGNAITFTQALTLDASGNLLLNGTSAPASSAGNLVMFNGTAPTGNVTNGCTLFCEDVSSSSELKVRDEAGNVTTLSPHNFSLIPQGPSEDMAWSYYSERDGKRINIDMLKAIRVLEKLSGEQLVHEA